MELDVAIAYTTIPYTSLVMNSVHFTTKRALIHLVRRNIISRERRHTCLMLQPGRFQVGSVWTLSAKCIIIFLAAGLEAHKAARTSSWT
mmetsp:Transcript_18374/g.38537  ORF Transcript_18374/g.38537 Transcript_18374/m.38537 type:complete len:89 (-) Transcript_18374:416-682(-)